MNDISNSQNIPPVFIINLPHSTDRRQHMQSMCSLYNIRAEFIEGVHAATLTKKETERASPAKNSSRSNAVSSSFHRQISHAEIACDMSHMLIYKKIVTKNIPVACIFEDDVDFTDELTDVLSITDKFPKQWEIVFLGHQHPTHDVANLWYKKRLLTNIYIRKPSHLILGAHAYLISLQGAKKLLQHMTTLAKPIDWYTGDYANVNIFLLSRHIVLQNKKFTSVTTGLGRDEIIKAYKQPKGKMRKCLEAMKLYTLFEKPIRPYVIRYYVELRFYCKNKFAKIRPPRKYI